MNAFQCSHQDCDRSYKRREHLLRHEKAHTNPRSFTCQVCPSAFSRSDLLSRHISLSHSTLHNEPQTTANQRSGDEVQGMEPSNASPELEYKQLAIQLDRSMLIELDTELAQELARKEFQKHYFRRFHPHWPILHQHTVQSKTQPGALAQAMLVAALWTMDNTADTKRRAVTHHDRLTMNMCQCLIDMDDHRVGLGSPRPEFLPFFQTLMITCALSTCRGQRAFPPLITEGRRLFRIFNEAGVFDQQRIDAANPSNRIVQEQYQRLAVLHFKVFVHANSLLTIHFPQWRLHDHFVQFDPAMLRVRVPSPLCIWDRSTEGSDGLQEEDETNIIGSLFDGDKSLLTYKLLTSIATWDFSVGMILGCYCRKEPDEETSEVIHRISPFLFWHLKTSMIQVDWIPDPTR